MVRFQSHLFPSFQRFKPIPFLRSYIARHHIMPCSSRHNSIAVETISSFIACNEYPIFESAWVLFLNRCEHANVHVSISPFDVPPFHWLLFLQRKIDAYLASYVTLRSILSLRDVESDVVSMLKRFGIPPLSQLHADHLCDPNEIDLSTDDDVETIETFEQFGIGKLAYHPTLRQYFPMSLNSNLLDTSSVLRCLDAYLADNSAGADFNKLHFESYLCTKYKIDSLSQGGVHLVGDLKLEIAMVREVTAARYNALTAAKQRFLDTYSDPINDKRSDGFSPHGWDPESTAEDMDRDEETVIQTDLVGADSESVSDSDSPPTAQTQAQARPYSRRTKRKRGSLRAQDMPKAELLPLVDVVTPSSQTPSESESIEESVNHVDTPPALVTIQPATNKCTSVNDSACLSANTCSCPRHFFSVASGRAMCLLPPSAAPGVSAAPSTMVSTRHVLLLDEYRPLYINDTDHLLPAQEGPVGRGRGVRPSRVVSSTELVSIIPWQEPVMPRSSKSTGRWGEALVYHYLQATLPSSCSVTWVNQDGETNAAYDMKIFDGAVGGLHGTVFADVKSTWADDRHVFPLSLDEWKFITGLPKVQYDIYRVYNAGDPNRVRIVVYHDVEKLVQERMVSLCLAV